MGNSYIVLRRSDGWERIVVSDGMDFYLWDSPLSVIRFENSFEISDGGWPIYTQVSEQMKRGR